MRMILITAVFGITCLAGDVLVSGDPPLTRSTVANSNGILERLAGSPLVPQQSTMIENTLANLHAVNGNTVPFPMRQRSLEYRDTCNPGLNSNKNLPLEKQTFPYQIVRGQYGDELVLLENGKPRWRYVRAQ